MTINATAVWRVRPSGSNTNGGGFDCAISPAATGTNGSFSGTTFTDSVAAAFTAGMVGSSINITGVGQYLITARIDASNITLGSGVPPPLSSGMAWTVGGGQDYSQQNLLQVNGVNLTGTTSTVTDATANNFTAAMVGNAMYITGGGATTGWYFVVTFNSTSQVVLDRSPGAAVTNATWNLGGGWADFWTNTPAASAALVPGNFLYILGSGTPNPSSYTYDYTTAGAAVTFTPGTGGFAGGFIRFANDPATPGFKNPPDTTGGMPVIKMVAGTAFTYNFEQFYGLYFVSFGGQFFASSGGNSNVFFGSVWDQFGNNAASVAGNASAFVLGCEAFDSVGTAVGNQWITLNNTNFYADSCNFHDMSTQLNSDSGANVIILLNCIIAKNKGNGVQKSGTGTVTIVKNCTIDGNQGHGVTFSTNPVAPVYIANNIISNHTVAAKAGLNVTNNTAAQNNRALAFVNFNVFYNNTADKTNLSYNANDTHGGSNPYVGQATENYTLA